MLVWSPAMPAPLSLRIKERYMAKRAEAVTARKDDASAAHQAALTKVAGRGLFSEGGGLIHTTSG